LILSVLVSGRYDSQARWANWNVILEDFWPRLKLYQLHLVAADARAPSRLGVSCQFLILLAQFRELRWPCSILEFDRSLPAPHHFVKTLDPLTAGEMLAKKRSAFCVFDLRQFMLNPELVVYRFQLRHGLHLPKKWVFASVGFITQSQIGYTVEKRLTNFLAKLVASLWIP
jgi:hypothetical protein